MVFLGSSQKEEGKDIDEYPGISPFYYLFIIGYEFCPSLDPVGN